ARRSCGSPVLAWEPREMRREEPSTLPQVSPNDGRRASGPASPSGSEPSAGGRREERHGPGPTRLGRRGVLFAVARGGMGTVYVGRLIGAHGFDRLVAIKRLLTHRASDAERAAFLSEARVTARISHPNVVETFELGDDEAAPFLVMQLVQGVSLARLRA